MTTPPKDSATFEAARDAWIEQWNEVFHDKIDMEDAANWSRAWVLRNEMKEFVEAAKAVSKRHEWMPNMGMCICHQHDTFNKVLTNFDNLLGELELDK